ncbi:sigma 54 modulation/S30EA ribosomal C-terminal domain-containing protein [Kitasatospora sp. NPDC093102]
MPCLTGAQARVRLDLSGLPFVFYTDAATGRGNVLYHRYDGHYGLITPAE